MSTRWIKRLFSRANSQQLFLSLHFVVVVVVIVVVVVKVVVVVDINWRFA